jgi:hypothetical protein
MAEYAGNAFWYCVVARDPASGRYSHYRCFWTQREAEVYKLQLEQMGDRTEEPSTKIAIEILPGGDLPERIVQ